MTVTVTADDLGTAMGASVDPARATALIGYATSLCLSIVSPLPDGAEAVVIDVAARAYANLLNVQAESFGPSSATFGSVSGGLWLTRQNKATLRRLAGGGGAFTIDTAPAGAGQGLPVWDQDGWADVDGWSGYDAP